MGTSGIGQIGNEKPGRNRCGPALKV